MEKLRVQCRACGKELQGNTGKTHSCGCSNMMTVRGDVVSAVDMSDVIMLSFNTPKRKNEGLKLSMQNLTEGVKQNDAYIDFLSPSKTKD